MDLRRVTRAAVALLAGALVLAGCGSGGSSSSGGSKGKQYSFAVMALSPFPQLQDMLGGFKQSATACGLVEGKNATYDVTYGQGHLSQLQLIAKQAVERPVSMFLALDTPSMVTAAAQTRTLPVIAVAPSYPVASGVVKRLDAPGTNVTGGTDHIDPPVIVDQLLKVLPNVKTVGIAFNPSEQNSAAFQQGIRPALAARGVKLIQVPVTGTGDVQSAINGLVGRVDAIMLGNDNTTLSAQSEIARIASQSKVPLVSSIAGAAQAGALMDLGADYRYLGRKAGEQACQILLHGAEPATTPFTQITHPVLTINTKVASQLGLTIAPSVLATATKVGS